MAHRLLLDDRAQLSLTGVLGVNAYDETMLEAQTENGLLYLEGEGLHVTRYAEEEGTLHLVGRIDTLCYRTDTPEKNRGLRALFHK